MIPGASSLSGCRISEGLYEPNVVCNIRKIFSNRYSGTEEIALLRWPAVAQPKKGEFGRGHVIGHNA